MTQDQEVVALLEQALLAEPGSLHPTQLLVDIVGWDSMGQVTFVGSVQDRWGVRLSVDAVTASRTVQDLAACVRSAS